MVSPLDLELSCLTNRCKTQVGNLYIAKLSIYAHRRASQILIFFFI